MLILPWFHCLIYDATLQGWGQIRFIKYKYKYICFRSFNTKTNTMKKMGPNTNTVETRYNTIPYNTIFNITRWSHGPQNLQTHIRTLIVLSFIWITLLRVIRWLIAHAVDSEWTHMCGSPRPANISFQKCLMIWNTTTKMLNITWNGKEFSKILLNLLDLFCLY